MPILAVMTAAITAENLTLEILLCKVNELAETVTKNQSAYKKEPDAKNSSGTKDVLAGRLLSNKIKS